MDSIPIQYVAGIIVFLLGIIAGLIALIYKHMFRRIENLEKFAKDVGDRLPRIETIVKAIKDNCIMCKE